MNGTASGNGTGMTDETETSETEESPGEKTLHRTARANEVRSSLCTSSLTTVNYLGTENEEFCFLFQEEKMTRWTPWIRVLIPMPQGRYLARCSSSALLLLLLHKF